MEKTKKRQEDITIADAEWDKQKQTAIEMITGWQVPDRRVFG
ncbi:MAG TPA: hypothetical protein PLF61_06485 [Candidatus Goldiibacteriota bacterium]|nr:hypothetical protein [Candidatus Goldiibacteriota bacterium]